jgi:hypothetical protein
MSSCPGLHCDGCGAGKITISAGGIAALVGFIYYETHKQQIDQGADDFLHRLEIAVVVMVIAVVTVAAVVAAVKIRQHRQRAAVGEQEALAASQASYVIAPAKVTPVIVQPARASAALPVAQTRAYPGYPVPQPEPVAVARHGRPQCTARRHPGQRV